MLANQVGDRNVGVAVAAEATHRHRNRGPARRQRGPLDEAAASVTEQHTSRETKSATASSRSSPPLQPPTASDRGSGPAANPVCGREERRARLARKPARQHPPSPARRPQVPRDASRHPAPIATPRDQPGATAPDRKTSATMADVATRPQSLRRQAATRVTNRLTPARDERPQRMSRRPLLDQAGSFRRPGSTRGSLLPRTNRGRLVGPRSGPAQSCSCGNAALMRPLLQCARVNSLA
jgi:hypothetical protein